MRLSQCETSQRGGIIKRERQCLNGFLECACLCVCVCAHGCVWTGFSLTAGQKHTERKH